MDPWIFHVILDNEAEALQRQNAMLIRQRQLRDGSNPFELPVARFKKLFRLTPEVALHFFHRMEPFLEEPMRTTAIPAHIKFVTALYFLAQGSYQSNIGGDYNLAVSQPSVSRAIHIVIGNMVAHYLNEYVQFPVRQNDVALTKQRFSEQFHFQNVLGCIDGTHIAIVQPKDDVQRPGIAYLNRKNYYSVNTQIICDADMKITAINARFPGSTHDSAIWQMSNIRRNLEQRFLGGEHVLLLGDSGYPLQPWLMTPIPNVAEGTPADRYNVAHRHTRNIVERCIGLLKSRFRCLLKHRVLHYSPVTAGIIIYACAILHNMCINANIEYDEDLIEENDEDDENVEIVNDLQPNLLARARVIQRAIVQRYVQL